MDVSDHVILYLIENPVAHGESAMAADFNFTATFNLQCLSSTVYRVDLPNVSVTIFH